MTIEIETPGNKHGIENIIFSIEEKVVELIVGNDSDGRDLAEALAFQKTVAMDEGTYELDSFNVKLPFPNRIRMKGNLEDIVQLLKSTQAVDVEILNKLSGYIKPLSFQSKAPVSDFFSMKSILDEELDCPDPAIEKKDLDEKEIKSKLEELFNSFRPEDRKNVLKFSELVEQLGPEKKDVLEKLSTGYHSPSIKT